MSELVTTTIDSETISLDYPGMIRELENYLNAMKNFNETLGELSSTEKRTAYYVQGNMILEIGLAMLTSKIDKSKREYRDAHVDIKIEDRTMLINELRLEMKSVLSTLRHQ
jgi:hypothetical protein